MAKLKHVLWAKSEPEVAELTKLGWVIAEQRRTHHSFWSVLMEWAGRGEPVLPEKRA